MSGEPQRQATLDLVLKAAATVIEHRVSPLPSHRLVDDLGFDSLDIAALAAELECDLDRPVLLNDWIVSVSDIEQLTVQSLADYLDTQLSQGA